MGIFGSGVLSLLFLLQSSTAYSRVGLPNLWQEKHKDLRTLNFGRLTAFWAQEAVAAPEAHRFMAELEKKGYVLHTTNIGIFEERLSLGEALLQTRIAPELIARLEKEVAEYDAYLP